MRKDARDLLQNKARRTGEDWFKIVNKASGDDAPSITEIFIYDEIGYWGTSAADFIRTLAQVTSDEIHLHLNSPGGEVFDGVAIYNALKSHPAPVHVFVDALAASAASFIAMSGDTITMTQASTMMIHDAHGICVGYSKDMHGMGNLLDKISDTIAGIYALRAGGKADEWRAVMREEAWFNAQEAVEAGLADDVSGDAPDAKNDWDLSIFNYAGRENAPEPFTTRLVAKLKTSKEGTVGAPKNENPAAPGDAKPDDAEVTPPEGTTPPAAPAAPEAEPAPTNPSNQVPTIQLSIGGQTTSDPKKVQAHIDTLETFQRETLENARKAFVASLAQGGSQARIPASKIDELENFALSLDADQYTAWQSSWEGAGPVPLFGNHAGAGDQGGEQNSADADRIAVLEGIVNQHKLANMPQDQLEKTPSWQELQTKLAAKTA